ncbi:MAG: murein biosynthesis integral membrane protein MurJ, partial [Kiritimatiellae bacterium]|nr:murein biosynthesis integral membrane protein MurJ [Kiritimatiellia bacterium]
MGRGHGILKNTAVVAALTALSRVLGLVREMLQSRFIGAGVEQSAFALAFAIPNMARKLFGEGAMTAAFVPVFKGCVETEAREKAVKLARAVMTMILLMLAAVVALAFLGLETAVAWRHELSLSGRALLTIRLIKTLLPYMIFICGAAFGMGVLNAMGRFKAAGFMPCLLNFFWIGILAWIAFHPELKLDQRIHRVAMAILVAGAAQMAYMLWRMHCAGVTPGVTFSGWGDAKVRLVWRNTAIAAVGAGAVQINYMLDTALAQIAAPWAAGVIGYAERLMDLPLGVIGVAFGTVLLPTFAGMFAKGDVPGAREAFVSSARNMLFVMLPAAVGLGILAPEVTGVIYQGGEFDALATTRVSRAVSCYAFGLGFFGLQKSLVPWFQAQNDMKTPLKVSVWMVCLNAALNVLAVFGLPMEWRHVGLAGSTVLCAGISCALLSALARRKNGALGWRALLPALARILAACALMAATLLAARPLLADRAPALALAALVAVGGAVYFAAALALMPSAVKQAVRRFRR